jgi:shikimate dehydrogenase
LNVTLPYKLDIMNYLDDIDPAARELGAINTIKLGSVVKGYNTDWVGMTESVKRFGVASSYDTVTIFGTGGAARAAIFAAKRLGAKTINVMYRAASSETTETLRKQIDELGVALFPYSEVRDLLKNSHLVINATSAGMAGKDVSPFDLNMLENVQGDGKVFFDAVFNPLRTPLLAAFEAAGAVVIDGLWMMIYQAIDALSIWLGRDIQIAAGELTKIHNKLAKELQENV